MVRKVLIGLGLFLGLLVLVGFLLPRTCTLQKSITVNAPVHSVFMEVAELKNWPHWSPWYNLDSSMVVVYSNPTLGEGSWYSWTSKKVGNGKMTVTGYVPDEQLVSNMDFDGNGFADATHSFKAIDGKTEVTWSFSSDLGANPLYRYFGLFMDSMIGRDYEKGLANLKTYVETHQGGEPVAVE